MSHGRSTDQDENPGPGGSDGGSGPPPVKELKVKINEVMVSNAGTLADEAGSFPPWVELFNPSDEPVDVSGLFLSDDLGEVDKWAVPRIPAAVMAPHGFLVIFCDGDPRGEHGLHASFILEPQFLQLALNEGTDLFFFDASELESDRSAGRYPDGSAELWTLAVPTPGAANSGPLEPPEALFVRGDANGDGRVNVTDMTHIVAVLFRSRPEPACLDRLDADDSGNVDISDALRIGDALFQNGPTLAPPFPAAGRDPTDDALRCPGG